MRGQYRFGNHAGQICENDREFQKVAQFGNLFI